LQRINVKYEEELSDDMLDFENPMDTTFDEWFEENTSDVELDSGDNVEFSDVESQGISREEIVEWNNTAIESNNQ
jgi:hypothetical protein